MNGARDAILLPAHMKAVKSAIFLMSNALGASLNPVSAHWLCCQVAVEDGQDQIWRPKTHQP